MQRTYKKVNTHKEATNSQSSAKDIQALQPQPQKSGHAAVCSCRWWGAITATVDKNHPAVSAANHLNARKQHKRKGGESAAANASGSPPRTAKMIANKKISEICHHDVRPPVALEAEDDDPATEGVTVNLPYAAAAGVAIANNTVAAEVFHPPLWNAWWCNSCTAQHFVGDGGELRGACLQCQVPNPIRNSIMLDPDEVEAAKKRVALRSSHVLPTDRRFDHWHGVALLLHHKQHRGSRCRRVRFRV